MNILNKSFVKSMFFAFLGVTLLITGQGYTALAYQPAETTEHNSQEKVPPGQGSSLAPYARDQIDDRRQSQQPTYEAPSSDVMRVTPLPPVPIGLPRVRITAEVIRLAMVGAIYIVGDIIYDSQTNQPIAESCGDAMYCD